MAKIKRAGISKSLFTHLLLRAQQRGVTPRHFVQLQAWLNTNPEVPDADWFKRFGDFTVCGRGELVKTFLLPGQSTFGTEI